jgi:hypothetical protein
VEPSGFASIWLVLCFAQDDGGGGEKRSREGCEDRLALRHLADPLTSLGMTDCLSGDAEVPVPDGPLADLGGGGLAVAVGSGGFVAVGGDRLGKLHDLRFHFLAGLELDDSAGRNGHIVLGAIRIAADARLAELDLEDTKITKLDGLPIGETFGQMIQRALDDVQHVLLNHSGLVADAYDKVAFR